MSNIQEYSGDATGIGFFVLGKKGYCALKKFAGEFGIAAISFVKGARDRHVENDWYSELAEFCSVNEIDFRTKGVGDDRPLPNTKYQFAIGWRWIISNPDNLVVFHDSLLPKYRGFSPLVNMLLDGVEEIGVTALIASAEYDKGNIVYQSKRKIEYPIKISNAIDSVIDCYEDLVVKTANDIFATGRLKSFPQDEESATYSLWRDENDYFINWNMSAGKIRRFVDSVGSPYLGAASYLNGEIVRILDVQPVEDVFVENRKDCVGKIIFFHESCPVIVCGRGLLKVTNLRGSDSKSSIGSISFRSRFEGK